nr:hypothetical protein [Tanacetum cinerariifolium]
MALVTRQGPSTLSNNTNPNNMTLESVQAMIDQALLRNSTNGDGSHSSHEDNRRNVQTVRLCFYDDIMKCQPLNFKGTEGVVGLTRWIKKNESVFQISVCAIENQEVLKKKMTDKYCPQGKIKKLEIKLWNLKTPKRQNVARVYNIRIGEKNPYSGNLPKCTMCHFHHNGSCTQKCHKCNKVGHFARDCRSSSNANVANACRNNGENPKGNGCFGCGATGHFEIDFPKLKNKDGENGNAPGWVHAVGNAKKRGNASRDPDSNVVTGHPFNIDLMPVELGSFDVIIGMDWLRGCHAMIVCDEKLVQIPYGNETLTSRGNESNNGRESQVTVISCSKAQEYMAKRCQVFLPQISTKKEEDKSEGKQLEDLPVIWDYPKVFPKDLSGLPPARAVEFQIDLIPGAA